MFKTSIVSHIMKVWKVNLSKTQFCRERKLAKHGIDLGLNVLLSQ